MTMPSYSAVLMVDDGTYFTVGRCPTSFEAEQVGPSLVAAGLSVRVRGIVRHFDGIADVVAAVKAERGG